MRDNNWLLSRLDYLWSTYFADISQINPVFIQFGRFARLRFGSIRLESSSLGLRWINPLKDPSPVKTIITITAMFKDEKIPQVVVDHTIAHELCHYVHGFSSPHKRMHRFPHEGGVIKHELESRGLIHLFDGYKKWMKDYKKELKKYYLR